MVFLRPSVERCSELGLWTKRPRQRHGRRARGKPAEPSVRLMAPRAPGASGQAVSDAPILFIVVPQTGHFPWTAGLPFFMVTCLACVISRFARHFTQYASM